MAAPFSGLPCLLGFLLCVQAVAQDLPTKITSDAPEGFDFEPRLMLQDIPEVAEMPAATVEEASAAVEKAKVRLELARTKQQRWQKLAKQGVLSRAEAESCSLLVAEALVKYQKCCAEHLAQQLEVLRQRLVEGSADASLVETTEASLTSAKELAADAESQLQKTRLEAAKVNLERHQRLFNARLVSKAQLQRAENRLLKLQSNSEVVRTVSAP